MKSSGSGAAERPAPAVKEAAFGRILRITVDGFDRGLNLVRTGLVSSQALPNDGLTFGNEVMIPTRAVLIG
jgi:hypothetical protein